ncbi:MAG: MaoC family dehydratase N-terminal domain-containing protein [Chloroflexi bacterium]|nr:MaoC family dehydratase N-terminal domain-containing protein [Chloroflexota bacterium]
MTEGIAYNAPALTDASLEEARSLIGVELRHTQWNHVAARDAIWHYAWGVGDDNPLWCDAAYGKTTRYGDNIASPTFLESVFVGQVAPKLRGIQWIYAGTDYQFFKPVRVDDEIFTKVKLVDAMWKSGSVVKRWIMQIGEVSYYDKTGQLIARALRRMARIPRARAEGGMQYEKRRPQSYSREELQAIGRQIEAEDRRGNKPRFWEDVNVGDELTPVVKGPLNVTDMTCYYMGRGIHYLALELAYRHRQRHPADSFIDPETGAEGQPARGHEEEVMAHEVGMPGAYDIGGQRIAWVSHMMTNWMGDDAFLKRLDVSVRRPNVFGDTTWCKGKVVKKDVVDGEKIVECEVWAQNQLNQRTAEGTAIVALPSRG